VGTARIPLAALPTPVEPMDRLGAALGMPAGSLWVKRDDLTGLGGGGNKARKLEYLCADALARGCDTLVTGGGLQSNHVRITAAAANRLGLACTLVIGADEPPVASGNVLVDLLLGAEIVWAGPLDSAATDAAVAEAGERLAAAGRRPYCIPVGGATAVGAQGYVAAADELAAQVPDVDVVVVADGTGGTHAGLAAGFGDHGRVLGVDVGARPDLGERVAALAAEAADLAGRPAPAGRPWIDHARAGEGYAVPTEECREAVLLAARLEGLIADPVYVGKGLAGLVAAVRDGRIARDARVVFVHTGGMPALFDPVYEPWVRGRAG
jgi:D-cysteine desulfhydrase family pyridoxal phosphate-dependent enzyme